MPTSRIRQIRPISGGCYGYPYLDGESADDFESALADLFADLRHLADLLGVDWGEAEYRGQGYHGEEAVASR
ncbi:hypothetical protein [Rhodococcus pyridinivorans]|uniref:hypothetical protein n=1 Tax=Rhodococcus pyridinivorans TaxID=103816 RepID=UPI002283CAC1|nr:hypothetical protein [Rhodococcus pyridinivorans]WAL49682.1 hypothetical protein OQN32_27100 [Rhodococcus pyridinivorans]